MPPPDRPEPEPLDPDMTAGHAEGELLALNMSDHLDEVGRAANICANAVEELFLLPRSALAGVAAYERFRAVEAAADGLARRAHEGAARWQHASHGEDPDL